MGKRHSHLERAILQIEDDIAALELARNALIRQRPTARPPAAKPKPKPAAPRPAAVSDAERLQARSLARLTQTAPVPEDAAS